MMLIYNKVDFSLFQITPTSVATKEELFSVTRVTSV